MEHYPAYGRSALRRGRARDGGVTLHVTVRCHGREALLPPRVRQQVVAAILWLQRNRNVLVHGFVVMSSHVHLVITLPVQELSRIMHSLKSFTANEINKALQRSGPLWDEGYHETALRDDKAVQAAIVYVEQNPVTAKMVTAADQYEWSSAWPDYSRVIDPWM